MAENWPWEYESMHTTQSGSSQSNQEATTAIVELSRGAIVEEQQQQRPSLVETLQTCLATSTSSGPSTGSETVVSASRSIGSTSRKVVMKRRSRASRRVPTTVVEATSSDFKETVHRLTGIAPPTPPPTTPVRPQPKRAGGPVTFIRPEPQVQPVPIPTPITPPAAPTPFWPNFDSFIKSEPSQIVSAPFRTVASSPIQTWWDAGLQESMMNPSITTTTTTTGPFDVSTSSGAHIDPGDLSIDDWFQHGSDYMH